MFTWSRSKDQYDNTVYTSNSEEAATILSNGWGDFSVKVGECRKATDNLREAKLIGELFVLGGDPHDHVTRTSYTRNGVPPRGSWINVWKWRCSCGEKSSGGLDRKGAHEYARDHRIAMLEEKLEMLR
jgi:hypothetical protein